MPQFEDITEAVGLVALPMKAPHVEIQDFDNDGRPDVSTSIVKIDDGELVRFDPAEGSPPVAIGQTIGVRAATKETAAGLVYTVSSGQRTGDAAIWEFNTRSEMVRQIGTIAIGTQAYVASLDVDSSGRYLYYVPGAHGGSDRDGSPLVQYHIETGTKKVIAFLHAFYAEMYGITPKGTYCTAISPEGDKVYITWNVSRGRRAWDCCGLTVVHVPESERIE